jgi:hypothetical protein
MTASAAMAPSQGDHTVDESGDRAVGTWPSALPCRTGKVFSQEEVLPRSVN